MESKVLKLINEIEVPKSQYNSFGKYNFRNNEDIQTALKPLLLQYDVNKKGMDKAQATGASQSYASKYAYGQALKLDDTKDADATNKGQNNVASPKAVPKASYQYNLSDLKKMVANKEMSSDRANELCKQGKVNMNA